MNSKSNVFKIVLVSLFCSIILLQSYVPFLGYIPIGPLNLTIIHITVIIAAIVLGPRLGMVVGGFWGIVTFVRAFVYPTSPLAAIVFTNPLISVLPRILIGLVAGCTYLILTKKKMNQQFAMGIAGILGALTNTVLVLGQIYLFYKNQSYSLYSLNISELLPYLLGVIVTNGIPEAILAGVVSPIISTPIVKKFSKKKI